MLEVAKDENRNVDKEKNFQLGSKGDLKLNWTVQSAEEKRKRRNLNS